jgi:hypothetical protein
MPTDGFGTFMTQAFLVLLIYVVIPGRRHKRVYARH